MLQFFIDNNAPATMTLIADEDGDMCVVTNPHRFARMDAEAQTRMINDLFAEHSVLGPVRLPSYLRAV